MASEDDNYGSLYVKGTPVAELKVNDIKKELDKRGLSKAGSKTQMLERLKAVSFNALQSTLILNSNPKLIKKKKLGNVLQT